MPTVAVLPVIIGIQKPELEADDLHSIAELRPAGFILFDRNIESPEQTRHLTDTLRMACEYEPLIAIDQEGGRVSRLQSIVGPTPTAAQLGYYHKLNVTRFAGRLTGELLSMLGINWNLAPVLDIATKTSHSNSLNDRCFAKTPDRVFEHAGAFIDGLHDAGILCCGKHFPGMGGADADPHEGQSIVTSAKSEIQDYDLLPFIKLAGKLDFLMITHAVYPDITGATPASLSQDVCTHMITQLRGFTGLLITDDLDMGAITSRQNPEHCFETALNAGNDLLLVCHEMARLTPDMFPYQVDANHLPRPRTPMTFSLSQFTKKAKTLNGICG